jgi:two-component system, cell cycle response regulator DivK
VPSLDRGTGTRRRTVPDGEPAPLVLIVDDTEDTRELYAQFLAENGLRIAQAVDGEHALLKIVGLMPDLVIMDLAMPGVDGWEATRQIKAHHKTKHIPVIVVTGHVTLEGQARARAAGAHSVHTKPCTPPTLLAVIREVLDPGR